MARPPGWREHFSLKIPEGDDRERLVCDSCGFIDYANPRVVVGAVCGWKESVLLCRRAIPPRRGYWTIPAGYLEERETTAEGAAREAFEEARAKIEIRALLAIYNIRRISQVQLIYIADLRSPEIGAGQESLEVRLFEQGQIPWSDLAFPSVRWALGHFDEVRGQSTFAPFTNPPGETGNLPPHPEADGGVA